MKTLLFILSALFIASFSFSTNAQTNLPQSQEKNQISPADSQNSINPSNQVSPENLDNKTGDGENLKNEGKPEPSKNRSYQKSDKQKLREEYLAEKKSKRLV